MLFGMNSTASLPEAVSSTSLLLWDPVYDNRLTTGSQEAPIALKSFAQNLKTVTGRQKGCKSGQKDPQPRLSQQSCSPVHPR